MTRILALSLALTLALSLGQLARHLWGYAAGAAVYEQAQNLAGVAEAEDVSPGDSQARTDFLVDCLEQSVFSAGEPPSVESPVVTLCTCTGHGHGTRWVVMGEVVNERK